MLEGLNGKIDKVDDKIDDSSFRFNIAGLSPDVLTLIFSGVGVSDGEGTTEVGGEGFGEGEIETAGVGSCEFTLV
jgi:hypothetical protein